MEIGGVPVHTTVAWFAVGVGVLGPLVALGYALRVDHRDSWRWPMMVSGVVTFAVALGAYISGRRLAGARPRLLEDPALTGHVAYADQLIAPTAGFFVLAVLTGLLNPRTGVLRLMLPLLLAGFAVIVLALTLLSDDIGARTVRDWLAEQF